MSIKMLQKTQHNYLQNLFEQFLEEGYDIEGAKRKVEQTIEGNQNENIKNR